MKINIKLTLLVALVAIVSGILISLLSYSHILKNSQLEADQTIQSLAATVYSTASAAAYLNDEPLANDVISGLLKNTVVECAEITSPKLKQLRAIHCDKAQLHTENLYSPFNANEIIGELRIYKNISSVEDKALSQVTSAITSIFLIVFIIAICTLVITYLLVSHPIAMLADELENIDFTHEETDRLTTQSRSDELGLIRNIVNRMLAKLDERLQHERNLSAQKEKLASNFKMICDISTSALVVTDEKLNLLSVNPKFKELWYKNSGQHEVVYDDNWLEKISFEVDEIKQKILDYPKLNTSQTIEIEVRKPTDSDMEAQWFDLTFNKAENMFGEINVFVIISDITEARQKLLLTEFEADHDTLTHLKNRRSTRRIIEKILDTSELTPEFALLLVDLDGFKAVNDTYGHDAGDTVLIEVANRYRKLTRKSDIVCRWGGDEFLIVLTNVNQTEVEIIAEKLVQATAVPIQLDDDTTAQIGSSIGAALYPKSGKDFDKLFDHADHAMYQVKKQGKNAFAIYQWQE
ncbi:putative GGDEF domain-containing protein [Catenovulum agarivorans DS-2]|uniref:Putative GGDEF domain-containing protein n=1 Tax=Catenovulum agarivorans DS-2 TaxID=1328313 RepID=W7Q6Q9_9ALTE|nr:GGDEF domain-containing protein [Catenovulum agarivorans]EWH08474.1 putative GGDEF domain-containing protein [Catenovulum agarivorans DS-2]